MTLNAGTPNVSIVAFLERFPRLSPLVGAITDCARRVVSSWSDPGRGEGWLQPRSKSRAHFTMFSFEAVRLLGQLLGSNLLANADVFKPIDFAGFGDFLLSSGPHLLTVQFGGFRAGCECDEQGRRQWRCPGSETFHSFRGSAYHRSFYIDAKGKCMLTGWPRSGTPRNPFQRDLFRLRRRAEHFGIMDKYHNPEYPDWQDDDCFGCILDIQNFNEETDRPLASAIEDAVRRMLAEAPCTVDFSTEDLSIVRYYDTEFLKIAAPLPVSVLWREPWAVGALFSSEIAAVLTRQTDAGDRPIAPGVMAIRYPGGFSHEGIILSLNGSAMRVAIKGFEDVVEFKLADGGWRSQADEPVLFVFSLEREVASRGLSQMNGSEMRYVVLCSPDRSGFKAFAPDLEGCESDGDAPDTAMELTRRKIERRRRRMRSDGKPLPEPVLIARMFPVDPAA